MRMSASGVRFRTSRDAGFMSGFPLSWANVKALVYGAVKLLSSAVLIIVSRPCLAQISANSRWKPAENAWRVPTGRPFKLPD